MLVVHACKTHLKLAAVGATIYLPSISEMRPNHVTGARMHIRFSFKAPMLGIILITVVQPLLASGYLLPYTTEYPSGYAPKAIYKSVDSAGKVTYSTTWPKDTVTVKEIAIKPGPTTEYVDDTRQRHEKIKDAALQLMEAREKREANREQEQNKRLERLALQQSAQPKVYERPVYVGWNPLWWPHRVKSHRHHKYPSHPVQRPGLSRGLPLRTGARLR